MIKLKRLSAVLTAVSVMMICTVSCSGGKAGSEKNENYTSEEVSAVISEESVSNSVDISGQTIYWLADYDLNPSDNGERSAALSLFEDIYGAKVEWIQCDAGKISSTLSRRLISGEPVDMVPYETDAVPLGAAEGRYQPLDEYYDILEMDTELWSGMENIIDMFEYNGSHYVIPYNISEPILITYSRKMMNAEGLDDPYKLYLDGEWDWNAMTEMMDSFVSNAGSGAARYGINGWFGPAVIQSTGRSVVSYENGRLINNIDDPEIERAGLLMQELAEKNLYNPELTGFFPDDQSTLFFAMSSWALRDSNAKNPDADLMIVPFPKSPNADRQYISCSYGAKMLVDKSDKGEAVATYIKCERLAAASEEYKEAARQEALEEKAASGNRGSYITEEQYDALQSYLDPENVTPVFDFGYGMGERMYSSDGYTYETGGVMNNLEEALLKGSPSVDSWAALRDICKVIIDEEVGRFNAG